MERILIVEDDLALNAGICFALDSAGYATVGAYNCQKAKEFLFHDKVDLAVLDVNLPDGNGFVLCKEVKEKKPELPVMFLTANDLEEDQIKGYDLGGEDYVTKPFSMAILQKKIETILRRAKKTENVVDQPKQNGFDDGVLKVDFDSLFVVKNGEKIPMTPNEYKILRLLIAGKGSIITRELMLEKLWDSEGSFVSDHTLTVTVNRLRAKLEGEDRQYIKTVRGIGYTWAGDGL